MTASSVLGGNRVFAKIRKLIGAAPYPAFWRAMAHGVMPTLEHRSVLSHISPRTVIDVGANKGQFSTLAGFLWPEAQIYAFEPLSKPSRRYRSAVGPRATLFQVALGEVETTADIHIASRDDSSSLLPLGRLQKELFEMDELTTIEVPVRRLDGVLAECDLRTPTLLKIDVQGFEYEVLRGLGVQADAIQWIYLEASFVELYRGQKPFSVLEELLSEMGFSQVVETNVQLSSLGQKIQSDFLFERSAKFLNHIE